MKFWDQKFNVSEPVKKEEFMIEGKHPVRQIEGPLTCYVV